MTDKIKLRAQLRERMKSQTPEARHQAGVAVCAHLQTWLLQHQHVALFRSLSDEIDTAPIVELLRAQGITCYFPEMQASGEMRFVNLPHQSVILTPGLGFDLAGHRLGRGKGNYDRFLQQMRTEPDPPIAVGIAMDCQIVEDIPIDTHDQGVDMLCAPGLGLIKDFKR